MSLPRLMSKDLVPEKVRVKTFTEGFSEGAKLWKKYGEKGESKLPKTSKSQYDKGIIEGFNKSKIN